MNVPHKRSGKEFPASSDFGYSSASSRSTSDYSSKSSHSTFSRSSSSSSLPQQEFPASSTSSCSSSSFSLSRRQFPASCYLSASSRSTSDYLSASSRSTFSRSSSSFSVPGFIHGPVHDHEVGYVLKENEGQFRYIIKVLGGKMHIGRHVNFDIRTHVHS